MGNLAAEAAGRPESVDDLFARARALLADYQQAAAERVLRQALGRLGDATTPGGLTRGRLLLTLANVRAERGHLSEGMAILDGLADTGLAGLVSSQRGLMLLRVGRLADALTQMDAAVPALTGVPEELCRVLLNRGYVRMRRGDLSGARADFTHCVEVAAAARIDDLVLKARFNLGYLDYLGGDLPQSLSVLDEGIRRETALGSSGGTRAVSLLSRARVLFTAGLMPESDADLAEAIDQFAASGARQDQAESELARAQVALTQRRAEDALGLARAARRRFDSRGSSAWSMLARITELQARLATGRRPGQVAELAEHLAGALRVAGLDEDARVAAATATSAHLAAGRTDRAAAAARALRPMRPGDKILTRVQARQARAQLASSQGVPRRALAEVKAGLQDLHRYQASFGSLDAQTAVMLHGRSLAEVGMSLALADGRPSLVFEWSERARALASRLTPVRPPEDAEGARLLEELRYVRIELRAAELSGRDDPALRARRGQLERGVRQRAWYASGPGDTTEPVRLPQVRAALSGPHGPGILIAHMVVGGRIHALSVSPRRTRVRELGPIGDVLVTLRRVRADLDTLALRNMPAVMRPTLMRSLDRGLGQLDEWLFAGVLDAETDGHAVVLVPSGALAAAPWTLLPRLDGRPVTVARSATGWLAARHLARLPVTDFFTGGPAGPGRGSRVETVLPHSRSSGLESSGLESSGLEVGTGTRGAAAGPAPGSSCDDRTHRTAHGSEALGGGGSSRHGPDGEGPGGEGADGEGSGGEGADGEGPGGEGPGREGADGEGAGGEGAGGEGAGGEGLGGDGGPGDRGPNDTDPGGARGGSASAGTRHGRPGTSRFEPQRMWAGERATDWPSDGPAPVVLASGPDLDRGEEEVRALGQFYPWLELMTGPQASGEAVLWALGHAQLVHIAAHGSHENANPLFSALHLVDGPLFGYDLSRTPRMPAQVVLSACDLGLATERPGDELLGMAAAFLHAGTGSVVASVARLADDVACDVTVDYHRGLLSGLTPSEALASATAGRRDAPLVCFGSGW